MKLRDAHIFDDDLVAAAKIDDDIMSDLLGGIDERLKRRDMKIADINPITGLEMLDGVSAHALAEQKLVVTLAAVEFVASGAAQKKIPALAAGEIVVAFAADEPVIALFAEQRSLPLPPSIRSSPRPA